MAHLVTFRGPVTLSGSSRIHCNAILHRRIIIQCASLRQKRKRPQQAAAAAAEAASSPPANTMSPRTILCTFSVQDAELECVVCQDTFSEGAEVVRLPCGHVFHETCVKVSSKLRAEEAVSYRQRNNSSDNG